MQQEQNPLTCQSAFFLALLLLLLPFPSLAQFGQPRQTEVRKERVEVDTSRAPMTAENEKAFVGLYTSFIAGHQINDDGEFQSGQGIDDSPTSRALFLHYVAKNTPEITLDLGRRCSVCLGNSKVWVKLYPDNPLSLAKVEIDCEDCPSTGLVPTEVTYRFIYTSKKLPDLPEKPKVTKLRNLIVKALGGDATCQLEYASMLENGAPGVPKDAKLAHQLFTKAFVSGSAAGLDGLIRLEQAVASNSKRSPRSHHALKLVHAKLNASQEVRSGFEINTEALGVSPSQDLGYIEVKIAEIEARSLYSHFKSGDLRMSHIGAGGTVEILRPLKAQMDMNEPVTAQAKVEYALIGYAMEPDASSFGSDRVKIVKQAAVSMDPVAYGILADVSQRGLAGMAKPQAAAVLFSISKKLSKSSLVSAQLEGLESRYDTRKCDEMLAEFDRTKSKGLANPYFIDAVLKLEVPK
jgi:hypothetical protein